jgi:hypothetical protein
MPPASLATRAHAGAVVKKLAPGAPGTRRLLERYGSTLLSVRYREVESPDGTNRRLTTVELVIDERPGKPREAWLRIAYGETELRRTVRQAGGTWDAARRLWRLPASAVKLLRLQDRVVQGA